MSLQCDATVEVLPTGSVLTWEEKGNIIKMIDETISVFHNHQQQTEFHLTDVKSIDRIDTYPLSHRLGNHWLVRLKDGVSLRFLRTPPREDHVDIDYFFEALMEAYQKIRHDQNTFSSSGNTTMDHSPATSGFLLQNCIALANIAQFTPCITGICAVSEGEATIECMRKDGNTTRWDHVGDYVKLAPGEFHVSNYGRHTARICLTQVQSIIFQTESLIIG